MKTQSVPPLGKVDRGQTRVWIGDRPVWIGDRPVWIGDRPVWIGDRPVWIGDRPVWIGDRPEQGVVAVESRNGAAYLDRQKIPRVETHCSLLVAVNEVAGACFAGMD